MRKLCLLAIFSMVNGLVVLEQAIIIVEWEIIKNHVF